MNIRKTRKMIKRNKMITFFLMRKGLIFLTKLKMSGLTTKKVMIFFFKTLDDALYFENKWKISSMKMMLILKIV